MAVDLPESPNNREEQYLASIAGQNVEVPECPWNRKEAYLDAIDGRITDLQDELEELENNPDVADIVDTYADLEAYDTSTLTDKDIIRVLNDETHDGNSTYYRYSTATGQFTYIGTTKQYTDFVGTDGTTAGQAGLVPAPATTDAGKFLKADGTWDTVSVGPTVVQTTGTSTTDVMSQVATSRLVYPNGYETTKGAVSLGDRGSVNQLGAFSVFGTVQGYDSVAIGRFARAGWDFAQSTGCIAIGFGASAGTDPSDGSNCIAIGDHAESHTTGEIAIGTTLVSSGYNNSHYRLLTGLYDGQSAHDAATVGQIGSRISNQDFATLLNGTGA